MINKQKISKNVQNFLKGREIQEISQFEECFYCGCKSKLKTKPLQTMMGPKSELICPAKIKYPELHSELVDKIENLYEEKGHPKSYVAELKKEINEIKTKFKNIPNFESLEQVN